MEGQIDAIESIRYDIVRQFSQPDQASRRPARPGRGGLIQAAAAVRTDILLLGGSKSRRYLKDALDGLQAARLCCVERWHDRGSLEL